MYTLISDTAAGVTPGMRLACPMVRVPLDLIRGTLSLEQARPTGIVGILHAACQEAGLPSASLWAAVPHYIAAAPNPKAALALVRKLEGLVGVAVDATDLEVHAHLGWSVVTSGGRSPIGTSRSAQVPVTRSS